MALFYNGKISDFLLKFCIIFYVCEPVKKKKNVGENTWKCMHS